MWINVVKVLVSGLCWLTYMFILWRRFRIDYGERAILAFGIWSGGIFLILGLGFRIWAGMLGVLTTLIYLSRRNKWDGWEMWDTVIPVLCLFTGILYWPYSLAGIFGIIILLNFRKFAWYKSGKPGLGGLMGLGFFSLIMVIKGLGGEDKYNLAGIGIDQMAGIWLLTGVLVSIYLRSRLKLLK